MSSHRGDATGAVTHTLSDRLQIRVISLDRSDRHLLDTFGRLFRGADVGFQQGIDVRTADADRLMSAGLVAPSARVSMLRGRRWHHEVGTAGAVGVARANRLAFLEDTTSALLLLEEDCVVQNADRLVAAVHAFLRHVDDFDMVVFGMMDRSKGRANSRTRREWYPEGFFDVAGPFWLLHCVLYSPSGRRKAAELLDDPLSMQIDSVYASFAAVGRLRIIGENVPTRRRTAVQKLNRSTIQTDRVSTLRLYLLDARRDDVILGVVGVLSVVCVLVACRKHRRRGRRRW